MNTEKYMQRVITLAKKGYGFVSPNPVVGAVIVKNGKVIGEGFHEQYGKAHAEVNAVLDAEKNGYDVAGSTIYVTLEPCSHTGKTPSCAQLLVEKKIKKIVIANKDPNPTAEGGIDILEKAGREVEVFKIENIVGAQKLEPDVETRFIASHIGADPCVCPSELVKKAREINKGFFSIHEKNRPFFTAKIAVSKNGMVAEAKGKRTQISGKEAGKFTQQLRKECDGILVGAQTVVVDNPLLSIREKSYLGKQPLRILIDPNNRIPKNTNIFRDENVLHITGKIDLQELCNTLKRRGILRILVEGGPKTLEYFLQENLIDELYIIESKNKLPENGVPAFPNGFPKKFVETEKWKCGEDTITRYVFEI